MPLGDVRSVHLPYCVKKQDDGTYVVLNREYKPLGFKTKEHVKYENYPISVKLSGIGPATAKKLSYKGSTDVDTIYFYNDGCVPTESAANMKAYLERLGHFAKLKVR